MKNILIANLCEWKTLSLICHFAFVREKRRRATSWILIDLIKMDTLFMMIDSPEVKSIYDGRAERDFQPIGSGAPCAAVGCIENILMRYLRSSNGDNNFDTLIKDEMYRFPPFTSLNIM